MDLILPWRRPARMWTDIELRYALRSWCANLPPIGRLIVVGDTPPAWMRADDVEHVPGNRRGNRWANIPDNVLLGCRAAAPEHAVIVNDDMFVMHPWTPRVHHRGPLAEQIERTTGQGSWHQSLRHTRTWLAQRGHPDPLSYELHQPLLADTAAMAATLTRSNRFEPHNPPQWRTVYGVVNDVDAVQGEDVKTKTREDVHDWAALPSSPPTRPPSPTAPSATTSAPGSPNRARSRRDEPMATSRTSAAARARRLVTKPQHEGFQSVEAATAATGAHDPAALAAWIGEHKYTPAGMKALQMAARARHRTRKAN